MEVNLIFKIAAVGILVSVLSQVLKRKGGTGLSHQSCRTAFGTLLDRSLYL